MQTPPFRAMLVHPSAEHRRNTLFLGGAPSPGRTSDPFRFSADGDIVTFLAPLLLGFDSSRIEAGRGGGDGRRHEEERGERACRICSFFSARGDRPRNRFRSPPLCPAAAGYLRVVSSSAPVGGLHGARSEHTNYVPIVRTYHPPEVDTYTQWLVCEARPNNDGAAR